MLFCRAPPVRRSRVSSRTEGALVVVRVVVVVVVVVVAEAVEAAEAAEAAEATEAAEAAEATEAAEAAEAAEADKHSVGRSPVDRIQYDKQKRLQGQI